MSCEQVYSSTYEQPELQFEAQQEYLPTGQLCRSELGYEASTVNPYIASTCQYYNIGLTAGIVLIILGFIGLIASGIWYKSNFQNNTTSGFTTGMIVVLSLSIVAVIIGIGLLIAYR